MMRLWGALGGLERSVCRVWVFDELVLDAEEQLIVECFW